MAIVKAVKAAGPAAPAGGTAGCYREEQFESQRDSYPDKPQPYRWQSARKCRSYLDR
ncbi:MAG: hypothetical protein MUC60_09535 [Oscillatoria sp. Prado101]|nr:hypothetical protein [Oscillatoria sp. Prado101]